MKFITEELLERMSRYDESAFIQFEESVSPSMLKWLRGFGLADERIDAIAHRCLLSLCLLVVERRNEFNIADIEGWLNKQVRRFAVSHWRDVERKNWRGALKTARLHDVSTQLGRNEFCGRIAAAADFKSNWIWLPDQEICQRSLIQAKSKETTSADLVECSMNFLF